MEKLNNPHAFPFQSVTPSGEPNSPEFGMTLRDWFAGQALAGVSSAIISGYIPDDEECRRKCRRKCTEAASVAFRIADAMLAASKTLPEDFMNGGGK
jgi:hypothetical protein